MKAIIILSGGIDSSTCLTYAIDNYGKDNVAAISINYGQKHGRELKAAQDVANYYEIMLHHINLETCGIYGKGSGSLIDSDVEIPHSSYKEQVEKGIPNTYVPFRNGLFISSVAAKAMSLFPDERITILLGVHANDSKIGSYPDCTADFISSMDKAIELGTGNRVSICTPFVSGSKSDLVSYGIEHGTPYHLTWSCYEGKNKPCGKCATCLERIQAFKDNSTEDPLEYHEKNI